MAHKKAQWSTSNGRDSNAKRRGVKIYGATPAISWNIIVRQKWNKFWPWEGVGQWNDFTLFAMNDGIVKFQQKKKIRFDGRVYIRSFVSIV